MSFQTNSHTYYNEFREAERRCAIVTKFPELSAGSAYSKAGIISFFEQKALREERERQSRELSAKRAAEKRERMARAVPRGNLLGLNKSANEEDLLIFPTRDEELRGIFNYGNKAPFTMNNLNREYRNIIGKKTTRSKRNSRKTRRLHRK
jgi:hypothetical protein